MARIKSHLARWALMWIPDLIIAGYLPERIGRYRLVDTLIAYADGGTI